MPPRTAIPWAVALVGLLATAPANGQVVAPEIGRLRRIVAATKPATRVRVELRGGRRMSGTLTGTDSAGFFVADTTGQSVHVAHGDVNRFWVRRRAVAEGASAGAGLGTGVGIFFGLLAGSMCEDGGGGCGPGPGQGALIGALLVGSAGGAGGAVIGAAFPIWRLRWRSGRPTRPDSTRPETPETQRVQAATAPSSQRHTGELAVQVVAARGAPALGGSASLAFRHGPVALGPELALLQGTPGVLVLGGITRLDLSRARAPASPYAVLGLGDYVWRGVSESWLAASIGAGVSLGASRHWQVEARWHRTVQNTGSSRKPSFATIAIGRRIAW